MLGLLKKNLILSTQRSKWVLCILGLYLAIGLFSGGADIVFMLLPIMFSVESVNAVAYDATCEWDLFASALPVSRRQIVLAQYLTSYGMILASSVVSAVGSVIYASVSGEPIKLALGSAVGMAICSLLYVSITTPVIYKFGVEKLRLVIMLMMIGIGILIYAVISLSNGAVGDFELNLPLIGAICAVPAIALCVGSIFVSMKIYENKEF